MGYSTPNNCGYVVEVQNDILKVLIMGDGTAWGGRLPCKQKFRWDRYPYPPPVHLDYLHLKPLSLICQLTYPSIVEGLVRNGI